MPPCAGARLPQGHSLLLLSLPCHILIISTDYVNVLLFFVPLGIIAGLSEWSPTLVFTLNFLAIVPLAAILSFATEEISSKLGETLGGLLNATFGNAVELIVSTISLAILQDPPGLTR